MTRIFESPHALLAAQGARLGPTDWIVIDQARVDAFADVTGDHQWIHVDVARAKEGPFGGTIAHGYLTMSLINLFLPQLIEVRGFAHAVNIGLDKLRFLAPVVVGSRIRAVSEIVAVEPVKGAIQAVVRVTVEIADENGQPQQRPALVADTISRYFPASPPGPDPQAMAGAVQAYADGFAAGDAESIAALYAPDATIEDPAGSQPICGAEAILAFYRQSIATGARLELTGPVRIGPDYAAFAFSVFLEWQGERQRIDAIDLFRFDATNKIKSMQAFWGPGNMQSCE